MTCSKLHDVIVAGGGPVGLFLACELAHSGLDVVIVEQADSPEAPLKLPPLGMRGFSVASAEALYRRGLLAKLLAAASTARAAVANPSSGGGTAKSAKAQVGHFAGIPIDPALVDLSRWKYRLDNPASTNFAVDMASLESVLSARAQTLGVEIRRGLAVKYLVDEGEQVSIHAGGLELRARWLVGCDGGRSAVRKLAGFEFLGTEPEFTAYYALVEIADPHKLRPGRNATPSGFYMNLPGQISIADFDGGAFDRSEGITLEHLQTVLRRVSETDVTVTALRQATSFTDRAKLATRYRCGRILLAGDAAHVHSALGGQGLNAGIGDAMNLGWKLAATVLGTAPKELLDTYQTERHPVGRWVLDWSRAQAGVMRPTPQAKAIESIMRELAGTRDGATYFAEQLWGISLRYDFGESHSLTGFSAPDFQFADGSRLADHLGNGVALLVDFTTDMSMRTAAQAWSGRLVYVPNAALDRLGLSALLVRPDGFVAWASDSSPDQGEFGQVATRWLGLPDQHRNL